MVLDADPDPGGKKDSDPKHSKVQCFIDFLTLPVCWTLLYQSKVFPILSSFWTIASRSKTQIMQKKTAQICDCERTTYNLQCTRRTQYARCAQFTECIECTNSKYWTQFTQCNVVHYVHSGQFEILGILYNIYICTVNRAA